MLSADDANRKEVSAFSNSLKKRVEDYQAYAKEQRAQGLAVEPRKDTEKLKGDPILSPDARDLLEAINATCQSFLDRLQSPLQNTKSAEERADIPDAASTAAIPQPRRRNPQSRQRAN